MNIFLFCLKKVVKDTESDAKVLDFNDYDAFAGPLAFGRRGVGLSSYSFRWSQGFGQFLDPEFSGGQCRQRGGDDDPRPSGQ